jgi:hypothetical protein
LGLIKVIQPKKSNALFEQVVHWNL